MKINILADSACDLAKDLCKKHNIQVVPLTVHLDNKDYQDGIDISPKEIYDEMRKGAQTKTSQVAPQRFKEIFSSYTNKDEEILLYLSFSSELSGTYQAAKLIENEVKETHPDAPIYVIDTKCASLGYGLVVLHAAELAANGASINEIIESVLLHSQHMEHIFTVDDLEYLYRGGRVSKTAAFVGGLLNIKPILNVEDGKLIPIEKIRGSKRLLKRMIEMIGERGKDFENQVIAISHGDDLIRAEQLANLIKDKYNPREVIIGMVGSVIGAHSGPGTLAVFFLNSPTNNRLID